MIFQAWAGVKGRAPDFRFPLDTAEDLCEVPGISPAGWDSRRRALDFALGARDFVRRRETVPVKCA
jgi:hypothetical protein